MNGAGLRLPAAAQAPLLAGQVGRGGAEVESQARQEA